MDDKTGFTGDLLEKDLLSPLFLSKTKEKRQQTVHIGAGGTKLVATLLQEQKDASSRVVGNCFTR